jgi:hypothetical protein
MCEVEFCQEQEPRVKQEARTEFPVHVVTGFFVFQAQVWQSETVTAGAWYSDFNTLARSLAKKLFRQLSQQGLIAPVPIPAPS